MMPDRLSVLIHLREASAPYRQRLRDSDGVRYVFCDGEEDLRAALPDAEVLLASIAFPTQLLAAARRLRWIQVTGAGVDRFLHGTRLPAGVVLTRVDAGFGDAIAEYVIAHLLARGQRLRRVSRQQAEHCWQPLETQRLAGKTLGVAGVGAIGRAVGERARAMGMRVLGYARTTRDAPGFERVDGPQDLTRFLAELDVLVLTLPLTRDTRHLVGAVELRAMKSSAVLINVARGAIVDEAALVAALEHGTIAGAILDVFESEPLPASSPLWDLRTVTVTAHHAGLNVPEDIIAYFLDNLRRFRAGAPLRGLIDPERGY